MQKIKLENVSFNKLKEFTSLGGKKNTTIKGKFTLMGEYELITKDGGDRMTGKEINKRFDSINNRLDSIDETLKLFLKRFNKLENLVYDVIEINSLKTKRQ